MLMQVSQIRWKNRSALGKTKVRMSMQVSQIPLKALLSSGLVGPSSPRRHLSRRGRPRKARHVHCSASNGFIRGERPSGAREKLRRRASARYRR